MIIRNIYRLAFLGLLALIMVSVNFALAAVTDIQDTTLYADDLVTPEVSANDLKPSECASIDLSAKVEGSGTINGTGASELILGSSGPDTINGGGGDDCIVAGGGNDDLTGDSATATVRDQFDSVSYSNNDGSANWSAAWSEIGETDGASSGDVLVEQPSFGERYTIYADADSYLDESNPSTNFGTATTLGVREKQNNSFRSLLHYNLSTIPGGTTINSATAYFYVTTKDFNPVNVHRVTASWTETAVTWTSAASSYNATVEGSFTPSSTGVYVSVDITSLVQGWINGTYSNDGLMLIAGTANKYSVYSSREETGTSQDPYLVVLTSPTSADQGLRIQNASNGASRQADLSSATSASLSFRYRRHGLDDSSDYVAIEISSTGAAPWYELARFAGAAEDDDWSSTNYDITSYISSTTAIRFISSASLAAGDLIYFDNVQIQYSGTGGNDVLLGGSGDDALTGGDGTDDCYGDDGTDTADATCENQYGIP
jgi:Ca2+-binding RTX toxin-like protein